MKRWMLKAALITSALWGLSAAQALTMDEAKRMAVGESDARAEAISQAVAQGSEKTAAYLQALADDVVNGISRYWYSLLASWHDDEALQREFAFEHRIQSESLSWDRTPCPEIALLVDDTSFDWITPFSNYFRHCNTEFVYALAKTGSPVPWPSGSVQTPRPRSLSLIEHRAALHRRP